MTCLCLPKRKMQQHGYCHDTAWNNTQCQKKTALLALNCMKHYARTQARSITTQKIGNNKEQSNIPFFWTFDRWQIIISHVEICRPKAAENFTQFLTYVKNADKWIMNHTYKVHTILVLVCLPPPQHTRHYLHCWLMHYVALYVLQWPLPSADNGACWRTVRTQQPQLEQKAAVSSTRSPHDEQNMLSEQGPRHFARQPQTVITLIVQYIWIIGIAT